MITIEDLPLTGFNTASKIINSQAITVWVSQDFFYIEPNYKKSFIPTILKINRKTQLIQQIKTSEMQLQNDASPFYFTFFIGIINLNGKKMLFMTEEAQLVCHINYRHIFKITKPIFLFFNPKDKNEIGDKQAKILINIVSIFEDGMYFSYSYDLTEPLYFNEQRKIKTSCFNWAAKFQKQLKSFDKMWSLPIIQGFVGRMEMHIKAKKIVITLISRRSRYKGGTQQYSTGLDQWGNASNFVETEQILSIKNYLISFIQIRGSVPLMWKQVFSYGVVSEFKILKNAEQNKYFLSQHIDRVKQRGNYENVTFLNLLSSQNIEKFLIKKYQFLIKKLERQDVFYGYFDIHKNSESKNFSNFNLFLKKQFQKVIEHCSFTAVQEEKSKKQIKILHIQKSIIRTNCLYCIDRTNIAQSRIAAFHLLKAFEMFDFQIPSMDQSLQFIEGNNSFANLFRNLWTDNADSLSKQYMGTQSTESETIRQGKLSYLTSIDHGMTSIERALRNINHQDKEKNECLKYIIDEDEKMKL